MVKSYISEAVVLKRFNYREADRVVTFYSKDYGKVVCLARGVRRMTSKKKSSLELGTQARFFWVEGRGFNHLTQTDLINSHSKLRDDLTTITQLYQLLEIVDGLTVEEQENQEVYHLLTQSLEMVEANGLKKSRLIENVRLILKSLGFTHDKTFSEFGLKNYIELLTEKKMRSKPFLTVNSDRLQLSNK
jgi:DNA repair protein RecO (recombination protein O)